MGNIGIGKGLTSKITTGHTKEINKAQAKTKLTGAKATTITQGLDNAVGLLGRAPNPQDAQNSSTNAFLINYKTSQVIF